MLGLLTATINAAVLWWPLGGFTLLGVEFTEPSIDHAGWLIVAAIAAGATRGDRSCGAHHQERSGGWRSGSGMAPGIGSLSMALPGRTSAAASGGEPLVGIGVAAAVAGGTLAAGARHFEQRTGRLLLSTNPLTRGMGLEAGPRL